MNRKAMIRLSMLFLVLAMFVVLYSNVVSAYGGECNVSADCTNFPGPSQCYVASCDAGVCYYNFNDSLGPSVSNLSVFPPYNNGEFNVSATVSDVCSVIKTAEYWVGSSSYVDCRAPGTGKTIFPGDDGKFNLDKKIEYLFDGEGYFKNDGQNGVCLRAQDKEGNWGECKCTYFETDSVPPERIMHVKINGIEDPHELLICGDNPKITAKVCDSESDIQGGEFFLDLWIPPQNIPKPWTGYWLHVVRQYMENGWHCADVEGYVNGSSVYADFENLSDGTHYLNQIRGKDIVENWGKIWDQNLNISFIKDTTSPSTEKDLIPAGEKIVPCEYERFGGYNITDGCYYVRNGTKITLSAYDPDPQGTGEFAGNVKIHYNVWWKLNKDDNWTLKQTGVSDVDKNITFTLNEDSYHMVEYWAEDLCGNEEEHHYELDIVDTRAPKTTKNVGDPKIKGKGDIDWYISSKTAITLSCRDQDPHPVGGEKLYWKVWWRYDENSNWTLIKKGIVSGERKPPVKVFENLKDSYHKFEYWCVDALGNEEEHHFEIDAVDNRAPLVNKSVGEPKAKESKVWNFQAAGNPPNGLIYPYKVFDGSVYITQNTPITLTCEDQLPHPVGNVSIHYMVLWKAYKGYSWQVDQNWTTVEGGFYNFTYDKDSLHVLYYYCEDALGNRGPVHKELDIVDTKKPSVWKDVSLPKVLMDPNCDEYGNEGNCDYWISQESRITLSCQDYGVHPVGDVTLYWRWGRTGNLSEWHSTTKKVGNYVIAKITPQEDCMHELQWYCVDALGNSVGSADKPFVEHDNVDTQAPNVTAKYVRVKKEGQSSFGDAVYGNESNPVTVAIRGEDTIKLCAKVHDYKQTGDEGVGVEFVNYLLKGMPDPSLKYDASEDAWCAVFNGSEIRKGVGKCGLWEVYVLASDKLGNTGKWVDGLKILVDNVPPVGEVLNPHAGNYYRDGKSFQVYAPAVDFGGDKCCLDGICGFGTPKSKLCNQNCPASGVDYCDFYAIDYNFEGMNQSEIKNCYKDLWTYFKQVHADPKVVYLGRVPYENGVCKGRLTIPENSGLTDTVFLGVRYVDKAGNDGINVNVFGHKYNLELALNPWFSPITMNMDNQGPFVSFTNNTNLPGPVTSGMNVRIVAEVDEYESTPVDCRARIFTDKNGSLGEDTGYSLANVRAVDGVCDLRGTLPEGLESGNYHVLVEAFDNLGNKGENSILMIVDNERPTLKVVKPAKGEIYGNMLPVSLYVEDSQSAIVGDMVRFRVREVGGFGNVWCLGGCEETPWLKLTKQSNGLYAGTFNLSAYGISGSGKYTFDAIVCDELYDNSNVDVNGIPIIGEGRNGHHCTRISIHGAQEEERPQCNDGVDNDGDGKIDYPADRGCNSSMDDSEKDLLKVGKLVINEFHSEGNTSEWIEFYNSGDLGVILNGYSVKDGNDNILFSLTGSLAGKSYLVMNIPSLPNGRGLDDLGDMIKLYSGNVLVDKVTYGNWDDGNVSDNAPVSLDEGMSSVGRCPNGYDSDLDSSDFVVFNQTATKGYSNFCGL